MAILNNFSGGYITNREIIDNKICYYSEYEKKDVQIVVSGYYIDEPIPINKLNERYKNAILRYFAEKEDYYNDKFAEGNYNDRFINEDLK